MRVARVALLVVAVAVGTRALIPVHASTGPIPLNCNRACLENVLDQYLKANVKHDPKLAPFSEDVKYTENAQEMKIGDGFWKTAQAVGSYRHIFADPEAGQVAMMGTMWEANTLNLVSLRLRVQLGRITEAEGVFFKPGGCDQCMKKGFIGRRGIYELLVIDDAVGPLILQSADAQTIKRTAIAQGMDTMRDDGARKVLRGLTTVEEVLAATQEDVIVDS